MNLARLLRPNWPERREIVIAAGLSLVLACGLVMPSFIACRLEDQGDGCGYQMRSQLRAGLGLAAWIWCLWLVASLSQHLLPGGEEQRPRALGLQIFVLTLMSPLVGTLLGLSGGALMPGSLYDVQVQASFAAVACLAVEYRQRRRQGEADAASLHHDAPALARRLDQARTALLQAQVEPHFLFNTLAHLRRLAHTDPQSARAMLKELRLYLAAALPELRQAETPLARELELVRAFLALHQRRMGTDRLVLSFEIAPGLDEVIVPSTCLLTLAENAIKHGIAPQVAGGLITVRAGARSRKHPGQLLLEVADTGVGLGAGSGGGTGLATLRARLGCRCLRERGASAEPAS